MELAGKRALITGASKGLGATIAQRLAEAGADVALHYGRDAAGAAAVSEAVRSFGQEALMLQADLADPAAVQAMLDGLAEHWPALDLLVNNAGVAPVLPWDAITPEQWQEALAVDLSGPFYVLRAALPQLRQAAGAAVVNIGSVVSFNGGSFGPAYAAAKAGLVGLTRSAARDLGPQGIRVNCVAPGPLESNLISALPESAIKAMATQTALRRIGTFADVADAVLWLLSPSARYITGQTLVVDGGRIMN